METVILTKKEFEDMLEYSSSIPSGTTLGKVWKRNHLAFASPSGEDWYMGEYVPDAKAKIGKDGVPETVGIVWRKIKVE